MNTNNYNDNQFIRRKCQKMQQGIGDALADGRTRHIRGPALAEKVNIK